MNNQRGAFVVLTVALTSFALWVSLSTMYVYSVNKTDALSKFKEMNDLTNVFEDFAVEIENSVYRARKAAHQSCGASLSTDCGPGYKICRITDGAPATPVAKTTNNFLCIKSFEHLTSDPCATCVSIDHGGRGAGTTLVGNHYKLEDNKQTYCGSIFGVVHDDVFADCSAEDFNGEGSNVLCAMVAIDNLKFETTRHPPTDRDKLTNCPSCVAQAFKIFVDEAPPPHPDFDFDKICGDCANKISGDSCTAGNSYR